MINKLYKTKDILFSEIPRYIKVPMFKPYWSFYMFFENNSKEKIKNYLKNNFNKDTILTDSGSSAIRLALKINNKIGEVLIPSFACKSVINSVLDAGCIPVFYDITQDFKPDVSSIKKSLSQKTIAIIAVHQYGIVSDFKEIKSICGNNICLIEDSAIPFQKNATLYGDYIILSFNIGKQIVSFGGGALLVNSINNITLSKNRVTLKQLLYFIINIYLKQQLSFFYYLAVKFGLVKKYNNVKSLYDNTAYFKKDLKEMSDLQARIVWYQIRNIEHIKENYKKIFDIYSKRISFNILKEPAVFFPIILDNRYELSNYLSSKGIETQWTFYPLHFQEKYRNFKKENLVNTEYVWKRELSLPIHSKMTEKQALYVVEEIDNFFSKEYQKKVRQYYKENAETYKKNTSDWRIKILNEYNNPSKKILDIGCGTGNYLLSLSNKEKTGIDISKESLDILKERDGEKSKIIETDILNYNSNEKFDLIYSFSTLYYIKEIEDAISKISDLMNDDAIAILEFGNKYSINSIWDKAKFYCPQFHHSEGEIKKSLINNDLKIEKILYRQIIPNFKGMFDDNYITGFLKNFCFRMIFIVKK